jgi:transposase
MSIYARVVTSASCEQCSDRSAALERAAERIAELTRDIAILRDQLREALKLNDLQGADLDRWRDLVESLQPNRPERVPHNELQLAFAQVITDLSEPAANDALADAVTPSEQERRDARAARDGNEPRGRDRHGRRALKKSALPVKETIIDPDEVVADRGVGWELLGAQATERVAKQRGGYFRSRTILRTWARIGSKRAAHGVAADSNSPRVVTAEQPESLAPKAMADASAVAHVIVSKYDDSLPLHRQETITAREGFKVARSTQCNWLEVAYRDTYRVVEAMAEEGLRLSEVIATDATSAPVRGRGECKNWSVFVFIMEHHHMVFRHTRVHDGPSFRAMLPGYMGNLVADAASIYAHVYRDHGMTESGDWSHMRRYFWKSLPTERVRSLQALGLIRELFAMERDIKDAPPEERLRRRRERSLPIADLFDRWIEAQRAHARARTPFGRAIGYYLNQREALRHFLDDGRVPIHNNSSEAALRKLVLGRANWMHFENETGLKWYCTFRSLIASCEMHGLNAEQYLEQLLRLAPHWPTHRLIELSPKHWRNTIANLDERGRRIITPPWELESNALRVEKRRVVSTAA